MLQSFQQSHRAKEAKTGVQDSQGSKGQELKSHREERLKDWPFTASFLPQFLPIVTIATVKKHTEGILKANHDDGKTKIGVNASQMRQDTK